MGLNFFKFKSVKVAVLLLFCLTIALALQSISLRGSDNFFLDWKQILLNRSPPPNPFIIFSISNLKNTGTLPELEESRLFEVLNIIKSGEPRVIILAVSPSEIHTIDMDRLATALGKFPKLLLFADSIRGNTSTFSQDQHFVNAKNKFSAFLTYDFRFDKVTRRMMISFDENRNQLSEDFEKLPKSLGISLVDPRTMSGDFSYLDSRQVFMKIWDRRLLNTKVIKDLEDLKKQSEAINDKIVFIATQDTFSTVSSPSINYRKDLGSPSIQNAYWTDAELVVTYLINLMSGEYVKTPPKWIAALWLTLWIFFVCCLLVFADLRKAIPYSFLGVVIFVLFGALAFKWFSVDLELSRGLLASFMIQYFGVPILLLRHLRKEDREKVESERILDRERVKSRFVVKAAKADLTLQLAARVSHDIRSPIMALQIACSVLKGKVSEDIETLVRDSTSRIKHIADDILDTYRGKSKNDVEFFSLLQLVQDLLHSYRQIYPQLDFKVDIDSNITVFIPPYSLQRCLSNLINNAIEALESIDKPRVRLEAFVRDNEIVLSVKDNGPGVSVENQDRLFQEKATFGKAGGTGLGLFQVRKELALYGAKISYIGGNGGNFEVRIPVELDLIEFKASSNVIILESGVDIKSSLQNSIGSGIELIHCHSVERATQLIFEYIRHGKSWSIFADLVLATDDETGFDLLDKIPAQKGQIILCTSLADHKEIQDIASRLGALLIDKDHLGRMKLTH